MLQTIFPSYFRYRYSIMVSYERPGLNKVANGTSNRNFARLISCLYYWRDWRGVAYIPSRATLRGYAATLFRRYTLHNSIARWFERGITTRARLGQRSVNGAALSPLVRFSFPQCGKRRARVREGSTRGWRGNRGRGKASERKPRTLKVTVLERELSRSFRQCRRSRGRSTAKFSYVGDTGRMLVGRQSLVAY